MTTAQITSPGIASINAEKTLIANVLEQQRSFFNSYLTRAVDFRIAQLQKLRKAIEQNEKQILAALKADLNKSAFEAYGTEIGLVISEIDHTIKKLQRWAAPRKVKNALFHFKSSSYILPEPYGVVLIIAPWNYPFQLAISPIVGAIAAGNCCVLKPSELAPHTAQVMTVLLQQTFEDRYIAVFNGGHEVAQNLLAHKFDYIFFTGSTAVGKIVYKAAAEYLTPVTLELGGKSPCIVDREVDIDITAKRIVWGKLVNLGQTCIAPDYLYVHKAIKPALLAAMKAAAQQFYGSNPQNSPDYGRIINNRHFQRLEQLMKSGEVTYGGQTDRSDRYIAPTFIENISPDAPIMQEEIFGPILPIIEFEHIDEVIAYVNANPKPLALYIFSTNDSLVQKVLNETSSGGVSVNDTLWHIGNNQLPFGGVGDSGMGSYHGRYSFDTFSHHKGVLDRSMRIDLPVRYAPYKLGIGILKRLMRFS